MAKRKKGPKLLTRRQVAVKMGNVHIQTITRWELDGMPVAKRGGRGIPSKYDLAAVKAWKAARDEAAQNAPGVVSLAHERARKEAARAALDEQMFKTREGKLLDADEVAKARAREIARVRTKLLAIPMAWADRVHRAATLEGLGGVERALNEAVREVLLELADPT